MLAEAEANKKKADLAAQIAQAQVQAAEKEQRIKDRDEAQKRADVQATEIKQKRKEKFGSSFTRKRDERTWNKGGIVSKPKPKKKNMKRGGLASKK
jgi:hypothetical protein